MAILSLALIALGTLLIVVGAVISVTEWKETMAAPPEEVETEPAGIGEDIGEALSGLAKLAEALKQHPLGMQFIILGIAIVIIGGVIGGLSGM